MIENTQKIIEIGPVIDILCQIVDFCIVKGRHPEKMAAIFFCTKSYKYIFSRL